MERPRGQGHNNRFLTVFWQDAVFLSGAAWQPFREAQHGSIFQRCGMAVFFRGAACHMAVFLRGTAWQPFSEVQHGSLFERCTMAGAAFRWKHGGAR
eukprot:1158606-Pelagomonas_calceolata.AAC.7